MAFERTPCVYILASKRNGTLYIGVTSSLIQRLYQHRQGITGGGNGKHMVYLSGVTDHHVKSGDMLDHIVDLVEQRAAMIEDQMSDAGNADAVAAE